MIVSKFRRFRLISMAVLVAAFSLSVGCGSQTRDRGLGQVVVYTSVDQVFSEPIFRDFERQTGIKVRAVFDTEETKSTGVVNRMIAESANPQADVFWSGDPVRQFLLSKRGLLENYISPNASAISTQFKSPEGTWTGFAARSRVLLVNKSLVKRDEMPVSVLDLVNPKWKGRIAIANPLYGTTTFHTAALFTAWGEERAHRFMNDLKANGVRIASSNGEVKRLVVAGEVSFGLIDIDDAFEAIKQSGSVEIVYPDQDTFGTLVMPTTVALVRGGPNPVNGRKLVDFLLSAEVEKKLAQSAAHMPLAPGVAVPENVPRVQDIRAMEVDYAKVASEIERIQPWLRDWVGL
jgi:iron(III) transport system substrate-binding protein